MARMEPDKTPIIQVRFHPSRETRALRYWIILQFPLRHSYPSYPEVPTGDKSYSKERKVSWLLRHGAGQEGLKLGKGGYVNVRDAVSWIEFHPCGANFVRYMLSRARKREYF